MKFDGTPLPRGKSEPPENRWFFMAKKSYFSPHFRIFT
jgi:hypothetical protein